MIQLRKRIGLGSLSLLLCVLAILLLFSFGNKGCIGDMILNFLGLKAWSSGSHGFHITIFYSLIFFIPAFVLGLKFDTDLGAVSGKNISLFACIIIAVLILLSIISLLYY